MSQNCPTASERYQNTKEIINEHILENLKKFEKIIDFDDFFNFLKVFAYNHFDNLNEFTLVHFTFWHYFAFKKTSSDTFGTSMNPVDVTCGHLIDLRRILKNHQKSAFLMIFP